MKREELLSCLAAALHASLRAGDAILRVYAGEFSVEHKEDNSPLTLADRESHRIIRESLKSVGLESKIEFLSEEGRDIPYEERRCWRRFWLVDPLDGTKEFIKRNGEFTVNIALIEEQIPVLGVIYVPVKGEIFFGGRETGVYKGKRESVSEFVEGARAGRYELGLFERLLLTGHKETGPLTIAGSRSHKNENLTDFVERARKKFTDVEFISAGSALKFCLIAEGKAQVYPRYGPTMEWDTGAGQAIVEGVGGRVCEMGSGTPLLYNKEDLHNPWFFADDGLNRGIVL